MEPVSRMPWPVAIFEFEFGPLINLDTSLGFSLHLTLSQVNGSHSSLFIAAHCKSFNQFNTLLEKIGQTGSYRLSVPFHYFEEGSYLVNLRMNISCIRYQYIWSSYYSRHRTPQDRCGCDEWQIRGTSSSLQIAAKQG